MEGNKAIYTAVIIMVAIIAVSSVTIITGFASKFSISRAGSISALKPSKTNDYIIKTSEEDLYRRSTDVTAYASAAEVLEFRAEGGTDKGLLIPVGKITIYSDRVFAYLGESIDIYYEDANSGKVVFAKSVPRTSDKIFYIKVKGGWVPIDSLSGGVNAYMWTISEEHGGYKGDGLELQLYTETSAPAQITYLGHSAGSINIVGDWKYGLKDISKSSSDFKTDFGIILRSPLASAPADEFTVSAP